MKSQAKFVFPVLVLSLLAGCSAPEPVTELSGPCDGVAVLVNFSGQGENITKCVGVQGESALTADLLEAAGVSTEGTAAYGDQVVCRVNGVPSETEALVVEGNDPYFESCQEMPPGFAYWALWLKKSGNSDWEYASEGVNSLMLNPGDSVGLAFSLAGATPTPDSE